MAVGTDQHEFADLSRLADAVRQDAVQVLCEARRFVIVGDALAKTGQHQIRRLQRTLGMLGERQRQIMDAGQALAPLDRARPDGDRRIERQEYDADQNGR